MVSVITCTMRESCLENVFSNYERQQLDEKELIIVLTKKEMDMGKWEKEAKKYKNVSVFQVTDGSSLGKCLNFAVKKAKYDVIANFDDDDYYTSDYLKASLTTMMETNAQVIGKTTIYLYLPERKVLAIFNSNNEHQYVNDQDSIGKQYVGGATLVFKRHVLNKVLFRNQTQEVDRLFCKDCVREGFRVYSAGRENFVYLRKEASDTHTWKVQNDIILNVCKIVAYTDDFKPYITRKEGE